MVASHSLLVPTSRRFSVPQAILVAVTLAALITRACEMPVTPLGIGRIVFSLAALAFVCFAPYQSFARRAIVVLVFEAIAGTLAFMLVDVPFVFGHQQQIGMAAVAIAENVERIERDLQIRR